MTAALRLEAPQMPPVAPEIEQAVLGAALLEAGTMATLADFLKPEVFAAEPNRLIYAAMLDLYRLRNPIETLTVVMHLKSRGEIDTVGGAFYVSSLTGKIASSKNVEYHARILVQLFIKREQIRIGEDLQRFGYDEKSDPFDSLAAASSEIRLLNEHGGTEARTMAEIMPETMDRQAKDRGVRFGFDAIDQKMRLEPGTVTIIGARPGMGKTAFMLSCAKRQAWNGNRPYVVELEMKDRNLATRLVCGECGIPIWKAKRKQLSEQDIEKMARWHVDNGDELGRMLVDESSSLKVSSLAARLDRAKRKNGIDVVWVDYIGLLQPSSKQRPGYDRMTAISNELRVLAKDMDLPFAVLAQLSRPVKGSAVKPPVLTDLRDSGEIEQDAEAVAFLHREAYYDHAADQTVLFTIAKNRDGEDGPAELLFDGPGVRMLDKTADVPAFSAALPTTTAPAPRDWTTSSRNEDSNYAPF